MKKVFLENLPHCRKNCIDWDKSVKHQVKFIYNNIEGCIFINKCFYDKNGRKCLDIVYDNKHFTIRPYNLTNVQLGHIVGTFVFDFKYEIGNKFIDEKRNITILKKCRKQINDKYSKKGYIYKCNKCGWNNGWISESDLGSGAGCSCCHSKTLVYGINDITTTASWMIPYFQGGYNEAKQYTKNSNKKLIFKCPFCGQKSDHYVSISTLFVNHGFRCRCSDKLSYLSKYIYSFLEQLVKNKIIDQYSTEQAYNWCVFYNPYKMRNIHGRYDFVIESLKIIIEADGGFHRENNTLNGQTKEESKFIDNEKDILAINNGYHIIRISDVGNIKWNIINSPITLWINIDDIDWKQCESDAVSNFVKNICDIFNDNPKILTKELSEITGFSKVTIRDWLHKGTELGWCNYDIKKRIQDNNIRNSKKNAKRVICLENNYMFQSIADASRRSKEILGESISASEISKICNNIKESSKGFHFQFVA